MIIIRSTVSTLYINEGVNTPLRGDYNHQKDEKWLAFRAKYNLKASDDLFKWYVLETLCCWIIINIINTLNFRKHE